MADALALDISSDLITFPTYHINLDLPPAERWQHVVEAYKEELKAVEEIIDNLTTGSLGKRMGGFANGIGNSVFTTLVNRGIVYYNEELKYISKETGIPVGKVAILQLVYEAAAHCTSIITKGHHGFPIHARTMDWEMEFLRPLTVNLAFWKENKMIFTGPSWAGYVGMLTGLRLEEYSVAVNFRIADGTFWENVKKAASGSWPIGFLVREVLSQDETFTEAFNTLEKSPLIAPTYFTLAGKKKDQGALITRDREKSVQVLHLDVDRTTIVQPNMDHWSNDPYDDIMDSRTRRTLATRLIETAVEVGGIENISNEFLWEVLSAEPIHNEITVYGCVMCPHLSEYEARLPSPISGFLPLEGNKTHGVAKEVCVTCQKEFTVELNTKGFCAHSGIWHTSLSDCNKVRCGMGLGVRNLGLQHWSCCFSTSDKGPCPKSGKHKSDL